MLVNVLKSIRDIRTSSALFMPCFTRRECADAVTLQVSHTKLVSLAGKRHGKGRGRRIEVVIEVVKAIRNIMQ